MNDYMLTQWLLFFFCYCFLGWIWECFYVSVNQAWKNKKWKFINRGFLHGPMIPIYGFASITILLTTIALREKTFAVFVIGALMATLFELVTGTVMEKLFKVKYWDYSNLPLNYKGHICLFVSLVWGIFSVLLVQGIHVPIEKVFMQIPLGYSEIAAFTLTVLFTCDTMISVHEAMDLREILETLSENSEFMKRMERRFDAVVAFTPVPDIEELRELKLNVRETLARDVEKIRRKHEMRIHQIKEHLQLPEFEHLTDRQELLEKLEAQRKRIMEKSNKQFLHATNQLKRNPNVNSVKYQEILEILKELLRKS